MDKYFIVTQVWCAASIVCLPQSSTFRKIACLGMAMLSLILQVTTK